MSITQYKRRASLVVQRFEQRGNNPSAYVPAKAIDLSQFHFRFKTAQADVESPNNCEIRVYNLTQTTVDELLKGEFSRVVVQAGYEDAFGVIFDGTLKQFRVGRENPTTRYLDLLAADGDNAYNNATISTSLAAGSTPQQRVATAIDAMKGYGVTTGNLMGFSGGVLPRGKVLFGMARSFLRGEVRNQGATWQIANGQVNIVPLDGYLPGEAVVLNATTGLIGLPEQTNEGILLKSLLNPRIVIGGLIQLDNTSINKIIQAGGQPLAFNRYSVQRNAIVTTDGIYRVFVAEHEGDTRGREWYTNMVCLAVDTSTSKVVAP